MGEDALSKADRYRKAANKYAELAKHAEPDYLAEIYRKVAVRYVFMAEVQRDNYDGRLPTIKLAKSGSRRVARRELPV